MKISGHVLPMKLSIQRQFQVVIYIINEIVISFNILSDGNYQGELRI
jgi:hypothetical protein